MEDVALTAIVVMLLGFLTAVLTRRSPRQIRLLVWLAFVEYMACAAVQYKFGLDAVSYRRLGLMLTQFFDRSFDRTARELLALLFHRPSMFDEVIYGTSANGTNTGSMYAASAWLIYFCGRSPYAAQALVSGLAMFGALGCYHAFQDLYPKAPPRRLFLAIVLFPSIAFWTASLHKESFCLMGIGLFFSALRAIKKRQFRAILYLPLGVTLIALFRAMALPAVLFGVIVMFVLGRMTSKRGTDKFVYIALGLFGIAFGVVFVGRVAPSLSVDQITESVANQQKAWALVEGGSTFDSSAPIERSFTGQLLAAPFGLLNAAFRPQLFDVRSPPMIISAIEMTIITWLLVRSVRRHGLFGVLQRLKGSPFLAMCAIVAIIGMTAVGVTTRNLGSMARYRVPFLPFYGTVLAILTAPVRVAQTGKAHAPGKTPQPGKTAPRRLPVRRPLRTATAPRRRLLSPSS